MIESNDDFEVKRFSSKDEWLLHRAIGGSSASAILGLNPYQSKAQLWDHLKGIDEKIVSTIENKEEINPILEFGHKAEPIIRDMFALDHADKYEVINPTELNKEGFIEILYSKKYPFMTATLDGVLIEKDTKRKGILEVKTCEMRNKDSWEKWKNKIPDNYYIQILHYLLVTNFEFVELTAKLRIVDFETGAITNHIKNYHFERSEVKDDLEYLLEEEIKFYEKYVVGNKRPPMTICI